MKISENNFLFQRTFWNYKYWPFQLIYMSPNKSWFYLHFSNNVRMSWTKWVMGKSVFVNSKVLSNKKVSSKLVFSISSVSLYNQQTRGRALKRFRPKCRRFIHCHNCLPGLIPKINLFLFKINPSSKKTSKTLNDYSGKSTYIYTSSLPLRLITSSTYTCKLSIILNYLCGRVEDILRAPEAVAIRHIPITYL